MTEFPHKPADETAFFVCPCFKDLPDAANRREEQLADLVFDASRQINQSRYICLNRALLVMVKAMARWMQYVPAHKRQMLERQIHDMLDHEMAHYPSKRD